MLASQRTVLTVSAATALSVKAATDLFTGKFLHSDGANTAFRGAILQKQIREVLYSFAGGMIGKFGSSTAKKFH